MGRVLTFGEEDDAPAITAWSRGSATAPRGSWRAVSGEGASAVGTAVSTESCGNALAARPSSRATSSHGTGTSVPTIDESCSSTSTTSPSSRGAPGDGARTDCTAAVAESRRRAPTASPSS